MDFKKGWPAREYPSANPYDKTVINQIMLRFRPIAPKPATDGSASDSLSAPNKTEPVTKRRAKRKYIKVKKNRKACKTSKEEKKNDLIQFDDAPVSLHNPVSDIGSLNHMSMRFELRHQPVLINFDNNDILNLGLADQSDRAVAASLVRVVKSWVVVDGMAETLLDVGELGSTDRERMTNLELDTCPGLISDGVYRVQWMNLAYKRMVDPRYGGEEAIEELPAEVMVRLVLKEKIPVAWPMFACTVRVVYTWRKEKYSKTMPCDVWKMDFGGFAWRLDAKAALSLGR